MTFPLARGPGRYQVELMDTTGVGIINVPVFVGVPCAPDPPPPFPDDTLSPADSDQQALAELAAVRVAHGLAPLQVDPRLVAVAHDHLADMVAHGWICHCWSDDSDTTDHLKAAGLRLTTFSEGVADGETGAGAIQGLFRSPGHRRDLLGDYTSVGVAAGRERDVPLVVLEYGEEP